MKHYLFHIRRHESYLRDSNGGKMRSDVQAVAFAREAARELGAAGILASADMREIRIEVCTAEGKHVVSVPLSLYACQGDGNHPTSQDPQAQP